MNLWVVVSAVLRIWSQASVGLAGRVTVLPVGVFGGRGCRAELFGSDGVAGVVGGVLGRFCSGSEVMRPV
ncbi:hypothetical protein GCM10025784_15900 [Citricoccus nitrophenolicus]